MVRRLKTVELFLSVGLAASVAAGCTAPEQSANGDRNSGVTVETLGGGGGEGDGGEGGEGSEGGEGGEGGPGFESLNWANTFADEAVITEFVDTVVIPNYKQFSDNTAALNQAIGAFVAEPTEQTLNAARQAWTEARVSWEKTETFAFGPAGSLGFDGAMDSWPVNQTDIENLLSGSEPITPDRVAGLQDTERGMHAIEYLLFGTAADKALTDFTDREQSLLAALGTDLNASANALLASWQEGIDGQPAYKTVFASAGSDDNAVYPTTAAAAQELVSGIIDSLTEVGEDKLAAPFAEQDVTGLESRFSAQTINDLKSNLQSAENGYLGALPDENLQASSSISTYVSAIDPALDASVKEQFAAANRALGSVPTPLEDHLNDPAAAAEIEGAIAAILAVRTTLEEDVVPLI